MSDDSLQTYVKHSLMRGTSEKELTELLSKVGWPKAKIKEAIQNASPEINTTGQQPIVRIEGISKSFRKTVLDDIYLDVQQGEIFGIIGPSGAGKTTLLNLLVGYYQPDKGDITILQKGKPISVFKEAHLIKKVFGVSTQYPSVYSKLNVLENLVHFGIMFDLSKEHALSRAKTLIHLVGLSGSEETIAANLSGGMQKRLDIACSLVHNPPILVLDEPTADLDPIMRAEMWSLISEINQRGTTVIVASHFLDEIENLCDTIAIFHNHKVIAVGETDKLKDVYTKHFLVRVALKSNDYKIIRSRLQKHKTLFEKIEREGDALLIRTAHPEKTLAFISAVIEKSKDKITYVEVSRPSMRELFTKLIKK